MECSDGPTSQKGPSEREINNNSDALAILQSAEVEKRITSD